MNSDKTIIITPLLAPPDPRSIEEWPPLAQQVWKRILNKYCKLYPNIFEPEPEKETKVNDFIDLSPQFDNEQDWSDIDITIDQANGRRNKRKIQQAEDNYIKITGKNTQKNDIEETFKNFSLPQNITEQPSTSKGYRPQDQNITDQPSTSKCIETHGNFYDRNLENIFNNSDKSNNDKNYKDNGKNFNPLLEQTIDQTNLEKQKMKNKHNNSGSYIVASVERNRNFSSNLNTNFKLEFNNIAADFKNKFSQKTELTDKKLNENKYKIFTGINSSSTNNKTLKHIENSCDIYSNSCEEDELLATFNDELKKQILIDQNNKPENNLAETDIEKEIISNSYTEDDKILNLVPELMETNIEKEIISNSYTEDDRVLRFIQKPVKRKIDHSVENFKKPKYDLKKFAFTPRSKNKNETVSEQAKDRVNNEICSSDKNITETFNEIVTDLLLKNDSDKNLSDINIANQTNNDIDKSKILFVSSENKKETNDNGLNINKKAKQNSVSQNCSSTVQTNDIGKYKKDFVSSENKNEANDNGLNINKKAKQNSVSQNCSSTVQTNYIGKYKKDFVSSENKKEANNNGLNINKKAKQNSVSQNSASTEQTNDIGKYKNDLVSSENKQETIDKGLNIINKAEQNSVSQNCSSNEQTQKKLTTILKSHSRDLFSSEITNSTKKKVRFLETLILEDKKFVTPKPILKSESNDLVNQNQSVFKTSEIISKPETVFIKSKSNSKIQNDTPNPVLSFNPTHPKIFKPNCLDNFAKQNFELPKIIEKQPILKPNQQNLESKLEKSSSNEFLSQEKLDYIEEWCDSQPFDDITEDAIQRKINENLNKSNISSKSDPMEFSTIESIGDENNINFRKILCMRNEKIGGYEEENGLEKEKLKKPEKFVKKGFYNIEMKKLKPGPQPKRIQTKITDVLKPVKRKENLSIQKQETKDITKEKSVSLSKKKRNKFLTPVQSQLMEKVVQYDIHILDDNMCQNLEKDILKNTPLEICFNIVYKENFCLLTQPSGLKNISCTPEGIMIGISPSNESLSAPLEAEFYYLKLGKNTWNNISKPKSLLQFCLTCASTKICFKSQSLFILLMDEFSFTDKEVSLEWIVLDPQIGCWLLDPDLPPTTFQGVMSQINTNPDYKIGSKDKLMKCCDMMVLLAKTMEKLRSFLEERNLWKLFFEVEMKIVSILSVMEHHGILCNPEELKSLGLILKRKIDITQQKAYDAAHRPFQLNSVVQVRNILYDQLKLDEKNDIKIKETATLGAKSTSEPMLQILRKVHPLPGYILEYRHLHKAKSTYIDSIIQHVKNGNVYTTWEITSTATGRITSSNPNLQAVPKDGFVLCLFPENKEVTPETINLRGPYYARNGYTLLAADFQHIELRVFAHLSQDEKLLRAIQEPGDIFLTLTKCWLGDKNEKTILEHREQTKRIMYAIMYGAGPGKLADFLSIDFNEAVNIIKDFTNKFKGLKEFGKNVIDICRKQNYLTSLGGRIRQFPNISSNVKGLKAQSERQAVNFCIQGSAADICKAAMIATEEKLKIFNSRLLLQIHDELVWEVLDSQLEEVRDIVKETMEDVKLIFGNINTNLPLPVSITTGKNWGDMK